jgi:hypothetical protein
MSIKPNVNLLSVTFLCIAVFLISEICEDAFAFPPGFVYYVNGAMPMVLIIAFLLNLGFALFISGHRIAHFMTALLVIVAFFGILEIPSLIGDAQQRWFLKDGRREYDGMIDKVIQHKSMLTSTNQSLERIVGRTFVLGKTNEDGSLFILFEGRGNLIRHGYLYYSGSSMVSSSFSTNTCILPESPTKYYFHLTNDWYSY